jgi:hypothetical protein
VSRRAIRGLDGRFLLATWPDVVTARKAAAFLAEEDGCTSVASRLDGLIAAALSDSLDLETMGVPEQTAFAFLSFTAESGDATAFLGRSLAAYTAGAVERAEQVTDVLRTLGRQFSIARRPALGLPRPPTALGSPFPPHRTRGVVACRLGETFRRCVEARRRPEFRTSPATAVYRRLIVERRESAWPVTVSPLLDWRRFRAVRLRHLFVVH